MKKALLTGFLAATALYSPVRAQNQQLFFDGYCIMGSLQACASVRVYSEGNTLRMRVWNLEGMMGDTHTMTSIGLYHSGTPWSGEVTSYSVTHNGNDITSYWTDKGAQDINNLAGVKLELKEGTQGNAGIVGCLVASGQQKWPTCQSFDQQPYVEFTFNLNSQFALADTELRWHSQQVGWPDEIGSLKCDTGGAGDYPLCAPMQVVPEPVTSLLLGSGLLGIGVAVARRRRRDAMAREQST